MTPHQAALAAPSPPTAAASAAFVDVFPDKERYPATLMFYANTAADTSRLRGRPNFYMSTRHQALQAFATFKSLALLHNSSGSSSSGGGGSGH